MRTSITDKFRSGKIQHLIATDIAARGLDFSNVTHVFTFRLSDDVEQYVHRSGRTGRHDRKGIAITLVTHKELPILSKVLKHIKREPVWIGPPPQNGNYNAFKWLRLYVNKVSVASKMVSACVSAF